MIKLNPYPYLAAVVVLVTLYGLHKGIVVHEVIKARQETTLAMTSQYQGMLLKSASEARKETTKLQLNALALEKAKDEKIKSLDGKLSAALISLSKRPARPATQDSTNTVSDTRACSGSQLYREDSEFLIREAARSDTLIIERDYYYQQYEDARKTLDEYANSH